MATIEKRESQDGKVTYRVKVRLKGYPAQSETFSRLTDARKWAAATESAIREGRHFRTAEAKKHTLGELVERYIEREIPRKGSQAANQKAQLLWWKKALGVYLLSDVTPALIAEQRDILLSEQTHQGEKRSPSTVNRYLAALSHAFTIAINEWGWLEDNPTRKVTKPSESRGRVRFLDDDERERLLKACYESGSCVLYPIVVLALSTGMRQGEILGLHWRDPRTPPENCAWGVVDQTSGRIVLHMTKNHDRRLVPLVGHALEIVRELSKVRRFDSELLFPSPTNPQKAINTRDAWEAALRRADIHNFRFHDLRHSAASYLAMNGASLAEIAETLGHKTLQMVKRYSHLSEAHTAGILERMNAKIFG